LAKTLLFTLAGGGAITKSSVESLIVTQGTLTVGNQDFPAVQVIARVIVPYAGGTLNVPVYGYVQNPNVVCEVQAMTVSP
jgi:hypothetical protein